MKIIEALQDSPAWHAHRAASFNASDAPAMLGCSSYKTRSQLLKEKSTGLTAEVDSHTQKIFNDGHRFEALARKIAEEIIGEDLFPVTGAEGKLSASFDGLTMMEDVSFEHKSLNDELRSIMSNGCTGADLPKMYRVQMEQQHMVSGCSKILFMASKWYENDQLVEQYNCWYTPDESLRDEIMQGWTQFAIDLENYQHVEEAPTITANPVMSLPTIVYTLDKRSLSIASNIAEYRSATEILIKLTKQPLVTDQDFADRNLLGKKFREAESMLKEKAKEVVGQISDVATFSRELNDLAEIHRKLAIDCEKSYDAEKEKRRIQLKQEGELAYRAHIDMLNKRLGGKVVMPAIACDFAAAMKGKKSPESLRDAVDTELARCKIAASEACDRMDANLQTLREMAAGKEFLFMDAQAIVMKPNDDMVNLIKSRIADHDEKEQARLNAEREKIRLEEESKARAVVQPQATIVQPAQEKPSLLDAEAQRIASHANVAPIKTPSRPTDSDIIRLVATHYGVSTDVGIKWLMSIDFSGRAA